VDAIARNAWALLAIWAGRGLVGWPWPLWPDCHEFSQSERLNDLKDRTAR
jgi:hypothetical protein